MHPGDASIRRRIECIALATRFMSSDIASTPSRTSSICRDGAFTGSRIESIRPRVAATGSGGRPSLRLRKPMVR
jgi:hypothetical protein